MARIEEITDNLIAHPCIKVEEEPKEVWDSAPMGKGSAKKCIEDIGKYIIDNAENLQKISTERLLLILTAISAWIACRKSKYLIQID